MPVKESSATALVRFTGLGILCFNKERRRGEIAAIRDDKHQFSVHIQRPVFQDGTGRDLLVYEDIAVYDKLPKDDVLIEINAHGRPAVEGYEIYQSGPFDRLGPTDPNDFRWVVNMSRLHGDASLAPTRERHFPLTKIYVRDGLFYTHKLDTDLLFEKVERDAGGEARRREMFGNVAETIGVKIEADEVSFRINAGGRDETHTLRRVEGLPFRVEIKNMDYSANAVFSDMPDYYRYLASPDGNQFDLAPVLEDDGTADGYSHNQKEFCHPIVTEDLSSIDEL
jgi:hypothetical protein